MLSSYEPTIEAWRGELSEAYEGLREREKAGVWGDEEKSGIWPGVRDLLG
jgi:hypothetical protein